MVTDRRTLSRRRGMVIALSLVIAVSIAAVVDLVVLSSRIREVDIVFPAAADTVDTWIIVGSDSRAELPVGASTDQFGTTGQAPGARADIILMVSQYDDGTTRTVSIPRDIVLIVNRAPVRAALAMQKNPRGLIDGLCTTLKRPDLLADAGLATFDEWAATFTEEKTASEVKPTNDGFRVVSRISKFKNVPALMAMVHIFGDVKLAEDLDLPRPAVRTGSVQVVPVEPSDELIAIGDATAALASSKQMNILAALNKLRAAALTPGLSNPISPPGSSRSSTSPRRRSRTSGGRHVTSPTAMTSAPAHSRSSSQTWASPAKGGMSTTS